MKEVWVFRHGPRQKDEEQNATGVEMALKYPEGIALTRSIAKRILWGENFKIIYTSPLVRAYQTGVIFALALQIDLPIILPGLAGDFREWENIISRMKGHSCLDFYNAAPEFVETEGKKLFKQITEIAQSLDDNTQAICVSHGGLIEPAIAATHNIDPSSPLNSSFERVLRTIPDIPEGGLAVFSFYTNNCLQTIQLHLL